MGRRWLRIWTEWVEKSWRSWCVITWCRREWQALDFTTTDNWWQCRQPTNDCSSNAITRSVAELTKDAWGSTAFQRAHPVNPFWGQFHLIPFCSLLFLSFPFFSYPLPLFVEKWQPNTARRPGQRCELGPGRKSILVYFEFRKCIFHQPFGAFCGNPNVHLNFWTKMGVSTNNII